MAKYFNDAEFGNCDPPCKLNDMKPELMAMLDELRERCNMPLVINCAYRSVGWDKSKGRSGNSAHTKGMAVDIRCNSSATRFKIVRYAIELGFNRIGIGKTFIHLDIDKSLPQNVMFDYYN